jgi:RNase H-fold protein (predicted Holliday junction resolvase)
MHVGAYDDYSGRSDTDPTNHRSHMNPEHVEQYKRNIDKAAEEMQKRKGSPVQTTAESKQSVVAASTHGGKSYYSPDEQQHIQQHIQGLA